MNQRRFATSFIFVTVVLDVMAGTVAFPVMPTLIGSISPGSATRTAELFGALGTVFFAFQFLSGPVQGALSDCFGRRPIILASTFGIAIDFVIMALAPNLFWLFVGRIISGVFAGSITAANAYVADTTAPEKRAQMFGLLMAAMGFGQAVGPAFGGFLAEHGLRTPFWAGAALSFLGALYGLFVLPESLPVENRAPLDWRHTNPIGASLTLFRRYPKLRLWMLVIAVFALGGLGLNNVFVVYTGYRYGWTPKDIGILMSVVGVSAIVIQAGLVGISVKYLGERVTMLAGTALIGAGALLGGLAPTGLFFWVATVLLILGNIGGPTQSAILSRLVEPSDQGLLSGALSSVRSLVGVVAPVLFTVIFATGVRWGGRPLSGLAMFAAGALFVIAGYASAMITRPLPEKEGLPATQ